VWIRFLKADRHRIRPVEGGVVSSVVAYKPGTVANVPREYGERLVAEGKAATTVSPRKATDVPTPA
jgi:hypothetical protein